ncbi:MAG: type II secretion system secretin GspD [Pontiellaceae bacterium]|nr:type II secretion system secretin GspD [Pontiellaceae bacterium]
MKQKYITTVAFSLCLLAAPSISRAQQEPVGPGVPGGRPTPAPEAETLQSFKFVSADIETVMEMYRSWTGKDYIKSEPLTATISLSVDRATTAECIDALETVLAMNNIKIVPYQEKFVKVVMANDNAGPLPGLNPDQEYEGTDRIVSQIITAQNVSITQLQSAAQQLMNSYGKIHILEGNNSMLVTDTEANILRIRELLDFIDQAATEVVMRKYEIKFTNASDLASTLQQIISMAQASQEGDGAQDAGNANRNAPTPQGVIRAGGTTTRNTPGATAQATVSSMAGAGSSMMIRGNVQVTAYEPSNIILVFSQEENFKFFDEIVELLDVEIIPNVKFEVVHLEYSNAADITSILNELIGAASQESGNNNNNNANRNNNNNNLMNIGAAAAATSAASESLATLSENTTIISDERSNAIILTGRENDIALIKSVIAQLDIMLEQVIIETAIFEVSLNDGLEHGINWLYQNQTPNSNRTGQWNVNSVATNIVDLAMGGGALGYYQDITGIDTQLAIRLSKNEGNAKLLSTPIIMTTDNTEASLSIGESRPVMTGTSQNTYGNNSQYSYRDIGIQLTVTPHINPNRFVVMEVSQQADEIGGSTTIDGNAVPIITQRSFDASVAVPDRGTVALGGLIRTKTTDNVSKIPVLGDIPLLGRLLFSSVSQGEEQTELVVLMTPYVMTNNDELLGETKRIFDNTSIKPEDWKGSDSALQYQN